MGSNSTFQSKPRYKGQLRKDLRYLAFSQIAQSILEGNYDYRPNFDEATKEIQEACARIRLSILANSVSTQTQRENWQHRWRKAKEKTSSSESGLHFRHCKAGAESNLISHFRSLKSSLAPKRGIALAR